MDEALLAVTRAAMLTFVVAGMASMGLSLTVAGILRPLRNGVLVVGLLVVNFVVVPALTVLATRVLPMEESAATAVILLGCCAGAPFLPALAKLAHGDPNLAVGSMVLLMVVTVLYAPLVVPRVVPGATVSAWDIASSLVVLMLLPLLVGLLVRTRYPDAATGWAGTVGQVSTGALFLALGAGILVSWRDVLGSVGTWIFVGALVVVLLGLAAGYLLAIVSRADRSLLALATAQRNISAALVIAASLSGDVVVRTLVAALVVPIILILLAGEIGKRTRT